MKKILITHPIHPETVAELELPSQETYLYAPAIGANQIPDEANDPTLEQLCELLQDFQPDVLIVGSNAVPKKAITTWRQSVDNSQPLLIIRRGVDTRAIDVKTAQEYQISVTNLPGINSPYVAQHMLRYLQLQNAKPQSKIAIIGTGNIGKNIAISAIASNLDVHLLSPSLQDQHKRYSTLNARGINPHQVNCAQSITEVMLGATYVAIAIPWLNQQGIPNANIINLEHINHLSTNARIASASVPGIFSPQALNLLERLMAQQQIYLRIDTAKRRAIEATANYPHLDIAHNQAFAAPECQRALDQAMLAKARSFIFD
ncbi:phosphoglycerate dehydrogenase-like oxidoreductase [Gloeocapsa sp. PCC 73106]|uniref:phosphoglycerate dehydrogenase-like oxidoreductase n=1 Tax=Gloeocapsa sp. PCC 73106 TaxID=102232 RepID=UPI0002ABA9EB|nr:phosphoglycerate dehydrogenase-like oxidoreductase [Gloeocapsa sp. PCC 73106]ELR97086.1 phosphoglycerate dehydrogenase-like oxidoreductase [Gloeocapsa sp. PCC 73106]